MSKVSINELRASNVIEMREDEVVFLTNLINQAHAQSILEVGVLNGGSSIAILQSIEKSNAHLYSVDYATKVPYGVHAGKNIGWAIDEYTPEAKKQWSLFSGAHVAEFIDKIASVVTEIDLCFLDTTHQLPGEILDFLIVLPYMKKDGIIVQHDVAVDHYAYGYADVPALYGLTSISNPVLFAVAKTNKFRPDNFDAEVSPAANIGAHKLTPETRNNIGDVFWALSLKWRYLPTVKDMDSIIGVFEKHYEKKYVDFFLQCYEVNKKRGVDGIASQYCSQESTVAKELKQCIINQGKIIAEQAAVIASQSEQIKALAASKWRKIGLKLGIVKYTGVDVKKNN